MTRTGNEMLGWTIVLTGDAVCSCCAPDEGAARAAVGMDAAEERAIVAPATELEARVYGRECVACGRRLEQQ